MQTTAPSLLDEIARFRQVREETLRLVEGLTQQEFDRSPRSGRWSIGEVLDHLVLAEQFFQRDLERFGEAAREGRPAHIRHSFRDLDIGPAFIPRSLLPALELPLTLATLFVPPAVLNAITASRLFPVRNPTVAEPRYGRPADALRLELQESSRVMIEFLEAVSVDDVARMTVSHPLLGTRSIPELIRFIVHHERRHQGQIIDRKAMLASGAYLHSAESSAEEAIRQVYRRISGAWSMGDAVGVAQYFAPDGDLFNPTTGILHRGRSEVQSLLETRFAGVPFRGSHIAFQPRTIRFITSERTVAIADGMWTVTGMRGPGGEFLPPLGGPITTVFQWDQGRWSIEADRPTVAMTPSAGQSGSEQPSPSNK
jgi:uncharacterized protein (TIGR02246 family)